MRGRVLLVFGARPEASKMLPVVKAHLELTSADESLTGCAYRPSGDGPFERMVLEVGETLDDLKGMQMLVSEPNGNKLPMSLATLDDVLLGDVGRAQPEGTIAVMLAGQRHIERNHMNPFLTSVVVDTTLVSRPHRGVH